MQRAGREQPARCAFWGVVLVERLRTFECRLLDRLGRHQVAQHGAVGLPRHLALAREHQRAVRLPVLVGMKLTTIEQIPPTWRLLPQLFVWMKSVEFAPVIVMLVMFSVTPPRFVTQISILALIVPTI